MSGNMRKQTALWASLAIAGAAILSSAASAIPPRPRDPVCEQNVTNACAVFWQQLGYGSAQQCATVEICMQCPPNYGYLCGVGAAAKPDTGTEPW